MAKHIDQGAGNRSSPAPSQRPGRAASEPPFEAPVAADTETAGLGGGTGSGIGEPVSGSARTSPSDRAANSIVDEARDQAKTLASEAKQQTSELAGQAREQVQTLMTQQKDRAAERLGNLAGALREAAAKLGTDHLGVDVGRYANRAADQVQSLSSYVRRADFETFVRDTGQLGRRRPEVFLGGTFLTGLLLARFLKASGRNARHPATGDR